jgi:flagellar hook-length control protein FliK
MPVMAKMPVASGKASTAKGGQTAQGDDATFADALETATSSDASSSAQTKTQKTQSKATDLLAMLLAALQTQSGSSLQSLAGTDGGASSDTSDATQVGDVTDGNAAAKTGGTADSAALDLRQLLALLGGSVTNSSNGLQDLGGSAQDSKGSARDRLADLPGLSSQDRSALSKLSTDDQNNLVKLLTGQKGVPDAFVQRLQTALAKVDPQLLKQLQARPIAVTVTSAGQEQAQSSATAVASTTVEPMLAEAQATARRAASGNTAHPAKTAAFSSQHQVESATAHPVASTAASDSAGHSGQKAGSGQEFLQGGGSELLGKVAAKTTPNHSGETSGFSLAGLNGHHGSASPLHSQGEGQLQTPSGTTVPEQQIVDQVVKGVGDGKLKGSSSITVKMHPDELGQVKLELTMSKDGLKAHLHAQTQQVQDVLEKNLPKLRHALEQQGLHLNEMQVSVDSGGSGGQSFSSQYQQGNQAPFQSMLRQPQMRMIPAMAASSAVAVPSGTVNGGLSVRI